METLNSIPARQIQVLIVHHNDFSELQSMFDSWLGLLFQGIQVLWTPQDEDDVLLEEKLLKDYPYLKPLCDD